MRRFWRPISQWLVSAARDSLVGFFTGQEFPYHLRDWMLVSLEICIMYLLCFVVLREKTESPHNSFCFLSIFFLHSRQAMQRVTPHHIVSSAKFICVFLSSPFVYTSSVFIFLSSIYTLFHLYGIYVLGQSFSLIFPLLLRYFCLTVPIPSHIF